MPKLVWRFQADVRYGDDDPMVTVFLGETETEDGVTIVRQDTRDPVTVKLSALASALALVDHATFQGEQVRQKAARKAAEEAAGQEKKGP